MVITENKQAFYSVMIVESSQLEVKGLRELLKHQGNTVRLKRIATNIYSVLYWPSDNTRTLEEHGII